MELGKFFLQNNLVIMWLIVVFCCSEINMFGVFWDENRSKLMFKLRVKFDKIGQRKLTTDKHKLHFKQLVSGPPER